MKKCHRRAFPGTTVEKAVRVMVVAIVSLFSILGQTKLASAGDPLMDRDGRTLKVFLNGAETSSIPKKELFDVMGSSAYELHWKASVAKGPFCIKVEPHEPRLGAVEKIDVLIHAIRPDVPFQQWRSYQTVPSTTDSLAAFASPQGFCPKELILTERLRFNELPPGEYVLRVAYWGVGNWDRQDILLTVGG